MTTPALPSTGQVNWGTPLNTYITQVVLATANLAEQTITTHATASDPHGDRAYALSLVSPITSNVNKAGGFPQLDATGRLSSSVVPAGGGRTSTFDVVADYAAPRNGVTDAAPAIQQALTDCATAGGGEVWVGDGTYALGSTLTISSGTWLHLSPGAVMTRITGPSGAVPTRMLTNFTSSSAAGAQNVEVSGGVWNFASSSLTGVPMAFAAGTFIQVEDTAIQMLPGCAGILLAGCTSVDIHDVMFTAVAPSAARSSYASGPPAVRVESLASSVMTGLPPAWTASGSAYLNAPCTAVDIISCAIVAATATDSSGAYTVINGIAGTTSAVSGSYHTGIAIVVCYATGLPGNAINAVNWQQALVAANLLNTSSGRVYSSSFVPAAGPASVAVVEQANTPPDTWHGLTLNTGYSIPSGGFAKYRLADDGRSVKLSFSISTTNTTNIVGFQQVTKTGLPVAYRPSFNHYFAVGTNKLALWGAGSNPDNESTQATGQLSANGLIYIFGVAADANVIYFDVEIPLDI